MNKPINNGGPAFPCTRTVYEAGSLYGCKKDYDGISLRAYIASKALQGYRANSISYQWDSDIVEKKSVSDADSLISELERVEQ